MEKRRQENRFDLFGFGPSLVLAVNSGMKLAKTVVPNMGGAAPEISGVGLGAGSLSALRILRL